MKLLHIAGVLALIASPTLAQNTLTPHTNLPSAQNSGAGVPGQAGNKNGPAAGPHGQTNQTTRLQDSSGIPGKPGGKSGPAVMPPSRSATSP